MSYAAAPQPSNSAPLLLCRRLPVSAPVAGALRLALGAEQRTGLRGLRHSSCGRALLLQLPRGAALVPGELLAPAEGEPLVQVEAAPEALLRVRANRSLALLQAAYHLGNRHVAMEIHADELRLLQDSVLAQLLEHRGLAVKSMVAPFYPESGAYGESHRHEDHKHAKHQHANHQHANHQHATDEHVTDQHVNHHREGHHHEGHRHDEHKHANHGHDDHKHDDHHGNHQHGNHQHGD
jgi:urease accessory protein